MTIARIIPALLAGIVLVGEVVPGLECPAIRLDDGRTVYLSALPSRFQIGDRVIVKGSRFAGDPTCQQRVLVVESAEAPGAASPAEPVPGGRDGG